MEKSSSSSAVTKLASILLIISMVLVVSFPESDAGITCDNVKDNLLSCVPYVLIGGSVPEGCCIGLKTLVSESTTTADRQMVCSCLKSAAKSATDDQFERAAKIPGKCGVDLKYKLVRDIDCSK